MIRPGVHEPGAFRASSWNAYAASAASVRQARDWRASEPAARRGATARSLRKSHPRGKRRLPRCRITDGHPGWLLTVPSFVPSPAISSFVSSFPRWLVLSGRRAAGSSVPSLPFETTATAAGRGSARSETSRDFRSTSSPPAHAARSLARDRAARVRIRLLGLDDQRVQQSCPHPVEQVAAATACRRRRSADAGHALDGEDEIGCFSDDELHGEPAAR